MSFMPVEYRDYVKKMQASNHQQYHKQRATPKVIVPNTELEDAPMSYPSVQFLFRDAQYSTLAEARSNMDKGFALCKRQSGDLTKCEAPWRVDAPPPSIPTPTKAPTLRQRLTANDLFTNAAHHSVMSSANTEPYAVPTSQRPPPPQQQAIRQERVSLDYRRADRSPLALIEDPPQMEESSSASPLPNPDLPDDHWRQRGRGKGKRPPPQRASRQPLKYARNDELVNPLPSSASSAT